MVTPSYDEFGRRIALIPAVLLSFLVFADPTVADAGVDDLSVEGKLDRVEQRMRDTAAVGVVAKLTLKAELDALLAAFLRFHEGKSHYGLDDLLHRYDRLMAKTMDLVHGQDPALFALLYDIRPEMAAILTHPGHYARVFGMPSAGGTSRRQ